MKTPPSQTTNCDPVLQLIKDFLDVECTRVLATSVCSRCGARMAHVDTTFFFPEGKEVWNIPLPFCPQCNLDEGGSVSRRAKALLTQ